MILMLTMAMLIVFILFILRRIYNAVRSLFLITKHVKNHGLMMALDQNLSIFNLSLFEASSTVRATHHTHKQVIIIQ